MGVGIPETNLPAVTKGQLRIIRSQKLYTEAAGISTLNHPATQYPHLAKVKCSFAKIQTHIKLDLLSIVLFSLHMLSLNQRATFPKM